MVLLLASRTPPAILPPGAASLAQAGIACAAEEAAPLRYRVRDGAAIDLGWTGLSHDQPWPPEQRLVFSVACGGGPSCALAGGKPGDLFGAPVPLSSGGVSACVVTRLRAAAAGTVDPETGCGEIRLALAATVVVGADVARPCALCAGDATPHDGRKEGRCTSGAHAGAPCDAEALSTPFGGATSSDCPAPGGAAGELALDLVLTTATITRAADRPCVGKLLPGPCVCEGQLQPTACLSGECPADERCASGPYDGVCEGRPFRGCLLGSGTAECEDVAAGAGRCTSRARPCFGATIAATGACSPTEPTYVAVFCTPATRAPALNATAGLPGPARLVLPLARLP